MSAEKTPTLSIVVPTYEKAIIMLKDLHLTLPKLAHAIDKSVKKLTEYLAISQTTKIYVLAMRMCLFDLIGRYSNEKIIVTVLNPAYKLKWIDENWSLQDAQSACKSVNNSVSDALAFLIGSLIDMLFSFWNMNGPLAVQIF